MCLGERGMGLVLRLTIGVHRPGVADSDVDDRLVDTRGYESLRLDDNLCSKWGFRVSDPEGQFQP